MPIYELPPEISHWRRFRSFFVLVILFFCFLEFLSLFDPAWFGDSQRKFFGYAGIVALVVSLLVAFAASGKLGNWKLKRTYRVEIVDGKLILRRTGHADVEISLNEIKSMQELPGWLVVKGGEPLKGIVLPKELLGYEELRRELAEVHEIKRQRIPIEILAFFPGVIALALVWLIFRSRNTVLEIAAGIALFLWSLRMFAALKERIKNKAVRWVLLSLDILCWVALAWVVYTNHQR